MVSVKSENPVPKDEMFAVMEKIRETMMKLNAEMTPEEFTVDGDTLTLKSDMAGTGAEETVFQRIVEEE